jgi:hypothetical protein
MQGAVMFKKKQPRLSESKLFEDDRMRLGAFLYAIENGFFNKDLIRLARGIDRRKLAGLPWSVDYLVAFIGGLMIPAGHPTAYKEFQNSLK